ncbi:hypothetical protein [Actinoplanes sp. NPDC026619]|uniref:hypothetical protein n=1 Tax=Actinoplanes sp. NPDC026619 TaxID=3155798 RepID=UPI0033D0D479
MVVLSRVESGQWVKWRVGRRRLAWRPGAGAPGTFSIPSDDLGLVIGVVVLSVVLLVWSAALLATAVVWPARVITGRWLVVAYVVDRHDDDPPPQRRQVRGRAAADVLARQWAADIKRTGRPQS